MCTRARKGWSFVMAIEDRLTLEQRRELITFLARERPGIKTVTEWFAQRGRDVSRDAARRCRIRLGPSGKPPQCRTLKVDLILKPEDRVAYQAFIRDPRTTPVKAERWFKEHGYTIGTSAVRHHLSRHNKLEADIYFAAQSAAALGRIVRAEGSAVMTEGMLTRFEQLVMEQLLLANKDNPFSTKELSEMSEVMSRTVTSRDRLEDAHRKWNSDKRDAVQAADAAAKKKGATPKDVAERIREVLGA
jgi:hypothetical protein